MPVELDGMVLSKPHPQNELNLFGGEWAYELPIPGTRSGAAEAFKHLHYCVYQLQRAYGSLRGWHALELGPNEGEVSFHLHHAGCRRVLSIEARVRSYLKCLVVKNNLHLHSVQFMLGDFVRHLEATAEQYDLCMAAGVLYHMPDPLRVIELICQKADKVAFATIYFDPWILNFDGTRDTSGLPTANWDVRDPAGERHTHNGFEATYYKYYYRGAQDSHETFGHGGPAMWASLLTKDAILGALEHNGMKVMDVLDLHDNPRGPHLNIIAERK